jgi:hypothetical protein
VKAPASSLKSPAEPLPSAIPAKRAKLPEDGKRAASAPTKEPLDALDFFKSRPQVAAMNSMRKAFTPPVAPQSLQSAKRVPTPTIEDLNSTRRTQSLPELTRASTMDPESGSWQEHHETILEFLRRLPVADPDTARVGPWLWVRCAKVLQEWGPSHDLEAFFETAGPLLEGLSEQRKILEQQNPGKAVGTITRKIGPYRDQLEIDLLNAATRHFLTSGKWMLFPMSDDLPLVWRLVAEATAAGKLGPCSKVGTWEPDHVTKPTVICIYTKDFSDLTDVKRVLNNLNDLDIVNRAMRINYKCDAYTHLGIMSDNSYKLRASLYSSDEVRDNKVKYKNGVITRLKTKNGAMEEFLNS